MLGLLYQSWTLGPTSCRKGRMFSLVDCLDGLWSLIPLVHFVRCKSILTSKSKSIGRVSGLFINISLIFIKVALWGWRFSLGLTVCVGVNCFLGVDGFRCGWRFLARDPSRSAFCAKTAFFVFVLMCSRQPFKTTLFGHGIPGALFLLRRHFSCSF